MPDSWLVTKANSRQARCASHWKHTALADSICSMAGPVLPTGKKRSGSVFRHAAWSRQSSTSHSILRLQVRATRYYLSGVFVKFITYGGNASRAFTAAGASVSAHLPEIKPLQTQIFKFISRGLHTGLIPKGALCCSYPPSGG